MMQCIIGELKLQIDIVYNKNDVTEAITEFKQWMAERSLNKINVEALENSKSKVLNTDLDNKQICIDILINKYPTTDLNALISNYLKALKQQEQDTLPF